MLLEEKIHEYWRDTEPLCSAIPADRFFTGSSSIPAIPCAVLMHEKTDVLFHTNLPVPRRKMTLRFEVYHDSLESGLEIARQIEQSFDRLCLHEPQNIWSFRFHFIQGENQQTEDGNWKFVRKFQLNG